jgi:predicted HTH transcriptional regulator
MKAITLPRHNIIEDTFWVNLIGKDYPSPNCWFCWCTERMKINPTSDCILNTVNKHGHAVIVFGTRKKVGGKVTEKVTENQRKILKGIIKDKHMTTKSLSVLVGISERKIKENIKKLKQKGVLKRIGPDKGGYWQVLK